MRNECDQAKENEKSPERKVRVRAEESVASVLASSVAAWNLNGETGLYQVFVLCDVSFLLHFF